MFPSDQATVNARTIQRKRQRICIITATKHLVTTGNSHHNHFRCCYYAINLEKARDYKDYSHVIVSKDYTI